MLGDLNITSSYNVEEEEEEEEEEEKEEDRGVVVKLYSGMVSARKRL